MNRLNERLNWIYKCAGRVKKERETDGGEKQSSRDRPEWKKKDGRRKKKKRMAAPGQKKGDKSEETCSSKSDWKVSEQLLHQHVHVTHLLPRLHHKTLPHSRHPNYSSKKEAHKSRKILTSMQSKGIRRRSHLAPPVAKLGRLMGSRLCSRFRSRSDGDGGIGRHLDLQRLPAVPTPLRRGLELELGLSLSLDLLARGCRGCMARSSGAAGNVHRQAIIRGVRDALLLRQRGVPETKSLSLREVT